jgi:hypothetical protein
MELLWSKSTYLVGDKRDIIQWGLDQPDSHFMLRFCSTWVFHSSIWGTDVDENSAVFKTRKLTHTEVFPLSLEQEIAVFKAVTDRFGKRGYDYKYFSSLTSIGFNHKILGKEVPRQIPKQNNFLLICHEALKAVYEEMLKLEVDVDWLKDVDWDKCSTPTYLKEEIIRARYK